MTHRKLTRVEIYQRLKAGFSVSAEQLLDSGMTAAEFAAATLIGALVDEDGHIVKLNSGVPNMKVRLGRQ